jgi:hypothetical protein
MDVSASMLWMEYKRSKGIEISTPYRYVLKLNNLAEKHPSTLPDKTFPYNPIKLYSLH